MTSPAASGPVSGTSPRRDRWLQSWLVVFATTLVLLVFVAAGLLNATPEPVGNPGAASSAPPSPPVSVAPDRAPVATSPEVSRQPVLESEAGPFPAAGLLQLTGRAPARGSGQFEFATGRGEVAGKRGPVRRYRVAVEKGSGEDVQVFAAQVSATLSDDRSWVGNGRERLQLVSGPERSDFTVYLATRDTAGRMCAGGGIDIRIGGVPTTSCRITGKAIINLDRWRGSARTFVQAGADLISYRRYVVNHEVGHELGHRHQGCPKAGGPAPVMVQQTITLRGCKPYAWPRRNDRNFAGPVR